MAFSASAKCNSHNCAEAQAAFFGINWCETNGYSNFTIELDSMLVLNMLKEGKTNNFKLKRVIEDTSHIMNQDCFREANQVADHLAKFALSNHVNRIFLDFQQLPSGAKGPFILDRLQMPTIRTKYGKTIFFVS